MPYQDYFGNMLMWKYENVKILARCSFNEVGDKVKIK